MFFLASLSRICGLRWFVTLTPGLSDADIDNTNGTIQGQWPVTPMVLTMDNAWVNIEMELLLSKLGSKRPTLGEENGDT